MLDTILAAKNKMVNKTKAISHNFPKSQNFIKLVSISSDGVFGQQLLKCDFLLILANSADLGKVSA